MRRYSFSVYTVKEMQARLFKNAACMLAIIIVNVETATAVNKTIAYSMPTPLGDHVVVCKALLKKKKRRAFQAVENISALAHG